MEGYRCFIPDCILNVEYVCPCYSPPIYICKMHVLNHMEVPNKDHALKKIFVEPCEKARKAILLAKCDFSIVEEFNNKIKEEEKIQRNFRNIIKEDLEEKKSDILGSSKSSELGINIKDPCLAFESYSRIPEASMRHAYLDIINTYQQKPILFNLVRKDKKTNLLIYNTEIESQESIILNTSQPLSCGTCITQLPNGKLFCFGNYKSGITVLIDENYRVEELPSGTSCVRSSAIYFNSNVYCFGGTYNGNYLTLSSRFDLDKNQWNELTPLPKPDYWCNSIILNESILISGRNKNLLRYSIDSDSFSIIPYEFAEFKRKILINAERLYLIECKGLIYESEIGNDAAWKQITNSSIFNIMPVQTCCQYIKKEIYIGFVDIYNEYRCFKLKLNDKRLIKLI